MVSVILTGGHQYIVTVGKKLQIDKLKTKPDGVVEFNDILNKNQTVKAKVIGDSKGKKVGVLKFKNKNRYLRNGGHRQNYSIIEITDIIKSVKKEVKPKK